jgi:hypothetical protein
MATVKDIKKGFCDDVYTELSVMKTRLDDMRDSLVRAYGADTGLFGMYDRHLRELSDQIEWKLQILSHACPHDWKGSDEKEYAENTASVGPVEKDDDFSPGYLGG